MADDDEVPMGARTMQVDAVMDALDVLERGPTTPPALPPRLPPRLPAKKRPFPIVVALVVAAVAVGAALLVSNLLEPAAPAVAPTAVAAPAAATTPSTDTTGAAPTMGAARIDLEAIEIEASHGDVPDEDAEPAAEDEAN